MQTRFALAIEQTENYFHGALGDVNCTVDIEFISDLTRRAGGTKEGLQSWIEMGRMDFFIETESHPCGEPLITTHSSTSLVVGTVPANVSGMWIVDWAPFRIEDIQKLVKEHEYYSSWSTEERNDQIADECKAMCELEGVDSLIEGTDLAVRYVAQPDLKIHTIRECVGDSK